jgi:hypothetical protein
MKKFITKYALTQGIEEKEGECSSSGYFYVKGEYTGYSPSEYFDTLKDAKENAENLRLKKIESLQKQLDKLNKMSFRND